MANVVKVIELFAVLAIIALLPGCSDDPPPSQPNPVVQNESIDWVPLSFEQAQALAVVEEKVLLVYMAASWCPHSARMERGTWVDPSVIAWVHDAAIAIRWELGGGTWMPVPIGAVPATAIYAGEVEIARHEGYSTAPEFLEWLV